MLNLGIFCLVIYGKVWRIGGQYMPFFGQTSITKDLPEYAKPFVIGHERGHLNGFASEAGATLLSMQTLFHSEDIRLEYLGLISLWRKSPPEAINKQVKADISCWNEDYEKMHKLQI